MHLLSAKSSSIWQRSKVFWLKPDTGAKTFDISSRTLNEDHLPTTLAQQEICLVTATLGKTHIFVWSQLHIYILYPFQPKKEISPSSTATVIQQHWKPRRSWLSNAFVFLFLTVSWIDFHIWHIYHDSNDRYFTFEHLKGQLWPRLGHVFPLFLPCPPRPSQRSVVTPPWSRFSVIEI